MITERKKAIFILISVCLIVHFCHTFYKVVKPHSLDLDEDDEEDEVPQEDVDSYLLNRAREIALNKHKIQHMKELIKEINEEQHINPVHKFKAAAFAKIVQMFHKSEHFSDIKLNNTVIVIQVHRGYDFVEVLLHSMRKVVGISGSLLIFAHDNYNPRAFRLIDKVQFARTMQMYYPYSTQLHPYSYPGDDVRFCPQWNDCIFSNERADANQIQGKLFWWWTMNEVFDRVEILKNYSGYIYFLEAESYLTTDFIVVAKKLEHHLPARCPECQIISLAPRLPKAEMYVRTNSTVVIGAWGWSYYSDSGFGFNRSTWNEIKSLKEEFCNFNDYTWEESLQHLASKTRRGYLYMLSCGEPRVFVTSDCDVFGSAGYCDLNSTYQHILNFTRTIFSGLFPYKYKLEFEEINKLETEERSYGGFEDARDRELCMFFSSHGKRLFY